MREREREKIYLYTYTINNNNELRKEHVTLFLGFLNESGEKRVRLTFKYYTPFCAF